MAETVSGALLALALIAAGLALLTVFWGVWRMGKAGDPSSNLLMRWRIGFQAVAIGLFVMAMLTRWLA